MPLYMDFHKSAPDTMEGVLIGHLADLNIQEKYGVTYHKYWMNLSLGTIYCLMEGPDKESCVAVHRDSHGYTACAIVEVDPAFFKLFMGDGYSIGHGPMLDHSGVVDLGYRNILTVTAHLRSPAPDESLDLSALVSTSFTEYNGREAAWPFGAMAIFNSADQAVTCALDIQDKLSKEKNLRFKIGIGTGQPLTEHDDFFGKAIKLSHWLCTLAPDNQIVISSLAKRLCRKDHVNGEKISAIRSLTEGDEDFINQWFSLTESNLSLEHFTIDKLTQLMGISRPQLYRRITSLAGRSPNELLRDQRMEKAFELLKKKTHNVSQVCAEVGYASPSYFAKCFIEKFGYPPSKFAAPST